MRERQDIIIIDVIEESKREYSLTLLWEEKMGSNDLCVCGSGRKQKKCHPELHEKSVIAALYRELNILDDELSKCNNSICEKGCNECSAADFGVSVEEFFNILGALNERKWDIVACRNKAIGFSDNSAANRCIFIDDTDGACLIYDVRPKICRKYGNVTSEMAVCEKIRKNKDAYDGLVSGSTVSVLSGTSFFVSGGKKHHTVLKPLVYWFANLGENGRLKTQRMRDLFEAAFHLPANDDIVQ